MTPAQVKVLLDALEAVGEPVPEADVADVVRWAKNAQHVRELLRHTPLEHDPGAEMATCPDFTCRVLSGDSHDRTCRIAAAWRALGDPRGAEDIERAHEEALRENRRRRTPNARDRARTARGLGADEVELEARAEYVGAQGVLVNGALLAADGEIRVGDALIVNTSTNRVRAARPFRQASRPPPTTSQSIDGPHAYARVHGMGVPVRHDPSLATDAYVLDNAGRPEVEARMGARAWVAFQRFVSDGRGMEAVETEARHVEAMLIADLPFDPVTLEPIPLSRG